MEQSAVTLLNLLRNHPSQGDSALIHTMSGAVSTEEVVESAEILAGKLGNLNGSPVALFLPNGPQLLSGIFGVWLSGGVAIPMNDRSPVHERLQHLEIAGPRWIIEDGSVTRHNGLERSFGNDAALVVWTSGTTGNPKCVVHTHAGYLEMLDRVLRQIGRKKTSLRPMPNLVPVSMALNAGIYNALFGLRAGAEIVTMTHFDTHDFAMLVGRHGIRSTVLPPAAMVSLVESEVSSLAPLRYVRSITAPLSPVQARRFMEKFGVFVLNGYGQAEMGEVIGWTADDAKSHPEKLGSIGRPHPGVNIRVDEDGLLWVRPPSSARGIEERIDEEGYVSTGDIAHIDEEGFVWLDGRQSDMINRGGNKVSPSAVEEVLNLLPSVRESCVVGLEDPRLGEVPVAVLVGERVPVEILQAHCREHLTPYKVPVSFFWVDSLPRTDVGKVKRSSAADMVRSMRLATT